MQYGYTSSVVIDIPCAHLKTIKTKSHENNFYLVKNVANYSNTDIWTYILQ